MRRNKKGEDCMNDRRPVYNRERRRHLVNSTKKSKDSLFGIILVQTALCSLLLVATYLAKQMDQVAFLAMKMEYQNTMEQTVEVGTFFKEQLSERPGWIQDLIQFWNIITGKENLETDTIPENTSSMEQKQPKQGGNTLEVGKDPPTQRVDALKNETGAGGMHPIAMKQNERLTAPTGAVLSPVMLSVRPKKPLSGQITSSYGYRYHPITESNDFHTGVDIAAAHGTPIQSVLPGVVVKVDESPINGNYIVVKHPDGVESIYCHCSQIIAAEGMVLRQGDVIAKVGSTGVSTGPHLHFEMKIDELYVNPAWLLPLVHNGDDFVL